VIALLDNRGQLDNQSELDTLPYLDILRKIDLEDKLRDHSPSTFTQDEKTEIAMFHSMKQDPYFKHQIYNEVR